MSNTPKYLSFAIGVLVTALVVLLWRGCTQKDAEVINQDYYVLTNQIEKMNKMIVLEQNFSSFQTHKDAAFEVAGYRILPKEMVIYTTAKAQVTYDLNKMKVKVDSVNKKLIIEELPRAEIKIFPDANIYFMDDYAINRYDGNSIKKIINSAKSNMIKQVKKKNLEQQGREQLVKNLNEIFVLAKALHYTVDDQTRTLNNILP